MRPSPQGLAVLIKPDKIRANDLKVTGIALSRLVRNLLTTLC